MTDTGLRFDADTSTLEGLLVPYGGSFGGRDSYGTYATRQTDFCLDWFEVRPLLYHHGLDGEIRTSPIGKMTLRKVDTGVWMKAQLDAHNEYITEIRQLAEAGALGLSSGAMAHLVEIDEETGEWIKWPIVEGSLTPSPSNLLAVVQTPSYASAFRSAGFEAIAEKVEETDVVLHPEAIEEYRATLTAKERDNLDDSDFAYIDSNGGRHLPIHDEAHVKAALSRFNQTHFDNAEDKAKARKKILVAAKKFGIEVSEDDNARSAIRADSYERSFEDIRDDIMDLLNPSSPFAYGVYSHVVATYPDHVIVCRSEDGEDETYWRIAYTMNDQSEPVLGEAVQVEQTYSPVMRTSTGPISLDASRLTREAAFVAERTQDLRDRRIREGRVISRANRRILSDAHEAMGKAHEALGSLLAATNLDAEAVARAANPDTWTGYQSELELLALLADL